jgi:hypothetical protein
MIGGDHSLTSVTLSLTMVGYLRRTIKPLSLTPMVMDRVEIDGFTPTQSRYKDPFNIPYLIFVFPPKTASTCEKGVRQFLGRSD